MARDVHLLHPYVRALALILQRRALLGGLKTIITSTLRNKEEQNALYAQGRTTPGPIVTYAKFGQSYHNFGLAFDIAVLKPTGGVSWDVKASVDGDDIPDYDEVGLLGESLGLEWGGRWRKPDRPHFQYTFGYTLDELRAGGTGILRETGRRLS